MNILFSPVGTTDPISGYNLREGALLHICRWRNIDKVYMYMSAEICGYHDRDNRFVYCLEKLAGHLGRRIDYEIIERRDLTDKVTRFDFFIKEFGELVNDIHEKNPGDTIFLNVSSGTPAMKSALQGLEVFVDYDVTPVQVTSPDEKSNGHAFDKNNYDPKAAWELNEDNTDPRDRTTVSDNSIFFTKIKKNNIVELIRCYDYVGAAALAGSMPDALPEDFLKLIHAADLRSKLYFRKARTDFADCGHKLLEVETTGLTELAEYLLILDLKVRREEYADFLRGITPLIADLFEMILKNKCGFDVADYTVEYEVSKGGEKETKCRWDMEKLGGYTEVISALNGKFRGNFKGGPVYSSAMIVIIDTLSNDEKLVTLCRELRDSEDKLRNTAAHEITEINEETIRKKLRISPAELVDKLFAAAGYAGIHADKKKFFDSYDKMNDILISEIS